MLREFSFSVAEDPALMADAAFRCVLEKSKLSASAWDRRQTSLVMDDLAHHVRFIASAAAMDDEKMLADYIAWVEVLCATLGFRLESMAMSMRCLHAAILSKALLAPPAGLGASEEDARILAEWFLRAADLLEHPLSDAANPYLQQQLKGNPSANLFLNALLEGKRDFAYSIVHSEEVQGMGLVEMYDKIFVPSQRELGRLWHLGKISVAQEHFVTAATQVIISNLYDSFFKTHASTKFGERMGSTRKPLMVAACAQGELHELGIRMIADTFQARGWDTIFLGANVPERDLVKEILRTKADFLSLSATIQPHVAWVERAITEVRKIKSPPTILVGGRPFFNSPDLWQKVGADGTAEDCSHAVTMAESLLATA